LFKIFDRILENVCNSTIVISGIFILLMGFTVTYSVTMRYLFHKPSAAAYEITQMLLVLGTLLALPCLERLRRNIRMDLVINNIPRTPANIITNIIGPLFGLFYCYILITRGWTAGVDSFNVQETTGSAWDVPIWWLKLIIPLIFALLFLALIAQMIKGLALLKMKRSSSAGSRVKSGNVGF
jgi:C4-dicarboxylate transporter, DctQ subunit